MVVSLLSYFFSMIMAFSAIVALLIGLSNNSAMESVLHYPRPEQSIIERAFATTNTQSRDLPDAPRIKKEEVPTKSDPGPEKNINDPRVLFAKADTAKRKHEIKNKPRLAHLNKPKGLMLARQRNNNYGYWNAPSYAENGPKHLFNW